MADNEDLTVRSDVDLYTMLTSVLIPAPLS